MASAAVLSNMAIPGLHQPPTMDDMTKSGDIYNTLPDDADQPQVAEVFISGLKALIKEFNVQNKFGLHLVHGHTRPMKTNKLNHKALHGYVFVLDADGEFHPYEFRQGPPPPMTTNDNAFIVAVQNYLKLNGLAGIIGVELLDQDSLGKNMKDFVLSNTDGTVMLPADNVNPTEIYRTTGWNAVEGITDLKGNESSHAKTAKGTHQVFTDGKALPDIEDDLDAEEVIIEALREAGARRSWVFGLLKGRDKDEMKEATATCWSDAIISH
ncbi:uncharacterized protein BDR25DRAFT_319554 [Lindgomyces ingoldianus]|uniref:Uncharacterized protein n=1 Tax=Lindgomyces ingoldianus TaxID=673940 RepID=A0ACB6QAL2_9PLEO|nr:uncharacterized protein BDR25DRAFT_319554 [Lindgomyces ingoldianus]KAF2463951.1 hypothetical protein BDR25DRAFT_319554 [Lindgomyces ingoldianus]